jgi:Yip1 domain
MADESESQAQGAQQKAGRLDDYVDVFLSPRELFSRRTGEDWVQPFIVLLVLAVVVFFVSLPATSAVLNAMAANNPQMAKAAAQFNGIRIVFGAIAAPIGMAVTVVGLAFLLWLVARVAEAGLSFKGALLVATFGRFIALLGSLLRAGSLILVDRVRTVHPVADQSFGVLRFMGAHGLSKGLVPLLGRFDIFPLWEAAVWMIAIAALCRVSRGRAGAVAAATWLLAAVPGMILALLGPASMTTM